MRNGSLYNDCPPFFKNFMDYANRLRFEECPDFTMLKEMIIQTANDNNLDIFDQIFDWTLFLTRKEYRSSMDVVSSAMQHGGDKN